MEFDFLVTPDTPPPNFGTPPESEVTLKDFTPKMFLKDVGKAYIAIGGLAWLTSEAQANPGEFMRILQKLLPRQVDLGLLEGTTIKLIDQFGQTIEVGGPEAPPVPPGPSSNPLPPPPSESVIAPQSRQGFGQPKRESDCSAIMEERTATGGSQEDQEDIIDIQVKETF